MSVGREAGQHECGAGLVEYSLLVVGISVVAMLSMMAMPTAVKRVVCEAKVGMMATSDQSDLVYATLGHPYDEASDTCYYALPDPFSPCTWWVYGQTSQCT